MAKYEKILVGVDLHNGDRVATRELSPESKAAVEQALELAIHSAGRITFCSAAECVTTNSDADCPGSPEPAENR